MSVSVLLPADKRYGDALALLARQKNVTIGKLVLDAIDARYADEIDARLSFFESAVPQEEQSVQAKSSPKRTRKSA